MIVGTGICLIIVLLKNYKVKMKEDTLPEYPSLTSPIFLEGVTASQFMVEEPSETKPMN